MAADKTDTGEDIASGEGETDEKLVSFFCFDDEAGLFLDPVPHAPGEYLYEPVRSEAHYLLSQATRRHEKTTCFFVDPLTNERIYFVVLAINEDCLVVEMPPTKE